MENKCEFSDISECSGELLEIEVSSEVSYSKLTVCEAHLKFTSDWKKAVEDNKEEKE